MKNKSIELVPIAKEKESNSLVRKSFRVPVSDNEIARIIFNQKQYSVSDINQGGVGLSVDQAFDFESNDILTPCELRLSTTHLTGLTGRVIHCSSSISGRLQYGIQWIDLGPGERETLNEILSQLKQGALENSDRNITTSFIENNQNE